MKTKSIKTRILSLLVATFTICSVASLGALPSFAAESDGITCTSTECTGAYENGFCSVNNTHYQEPALNDNGTEETADDYYEITNAGNLYWFASQVNSSAQKAKYNAKLMNDIVDNENVIVNGALNTNTDALTSFRIWTPMGSYSSGTRSYPYAGTFDGAGYTIKGLYNDGSAKGGGLFDAIGLDGNAVVKNVNVIDCYFYQDSTNYMGGIVDAVYNNGLVENCWSDSIIQAKDLLWQAGGIAGYMYGGTIRNCYSVSEITGEKKVGAIVGSKNSSAIVENCYYLSGSTVDGNGTIQNGLGSSTVGETTLDVVGETIGLSSEVAVLHQYSTYLERVYRAALKEMQEQIDAMENEISQNKELLSNELTEKYNELLKKNEDLRQQLESAKKELEEKDGELDTKDSELAEKNTALETAMNEKDTTNQTLGIIALVFGIVSFVGLSAMAIYIFIIKKKKA